MLLEKLEKKEGFTETEKTISDYLLLLPSESAQLSVHELADATFSSKASLLRFSQKLGFEKFRDLRSALLEETVRSEVIRKMLEKEPFSSSSTYADIIQKLPAMYGSAIEQTNNRLHRLTVRQITERILQSRSLDIYSSGTLEPCARMFQFKLQTLGLSVQVFTSANEHYVVSKGRSLTPVVSVNYILDVLFVMALVAEYPDQLASALKTMDLKSAMLSKE